MVQRRFSADSKFVGGGGGDGIIRLSVVSTLSLDKIKRRPSLAGVVSAGKY